MPRQDYDEIKRKFAEYIRTWKTKDISQYENFALDQVSCRISAAPHSNDEWDQLDGLKTFTETYPKTDVLQIAIYNYACRMHENKAQQVAYVICESINEIEGSDEMDCFYYCMNCANHWVKTEDGWKMDEVHMDVYPFYWTCEEILDYFKQTWYLGKRLVVDGDPGRYPAVLAELDLPWEKYPEYEHVLTEIEEVQDCFAKLFFSADYLLNLNRVTTRSKYMGINSKRYGEYEKLRNIVGALRYKRQKDRYWAHPWRFESIKFSEDKMHAVANVYRVFGWKQRNHEYVWTKQNVDIEHMCMAGYQEFVKEDGEWRVTGGQAKLGIYETGPYKESLYGDDI